MKELWLNAIWEPSRVNGSVFGLLVRRLGKCNGGGGTFPVLNLGVLIGRRGISVYIGVAMFLRHLFSG